MVGLLCVGRALGYPMPMSDGGYKGGATVEGRWGCIASAILGVPVFMFLLLADALGDCAPDTTCKKGFLTQVLLPTAIVAIGVGLLVRWAVKAAKRNNPD
ncbi:hypothetical protein SAMN06295937_102238 [Sphingopyxis flava]|uniref:Uncharacterized protein n=1 Tax=Sphingopyxis flava TaxID=1507287 RepID=A0A1T5EK11_9SPHN|nr:hypothetical protein SAMN06295937_102238 [Sphingopyxis flava]